MIRKVCDRPIRSDTAPQRNRPAPLKSELTATSVAPRPARTAGARSGLTLFQRSWKSGDWKLMIAIPAVILQKNTTHRRAKRPEKTARRKGSSAPSG